MSYLPAEWHKQSLIQLTWPHKDTDWAYMLDEVNDCFLKIAYEVLKRQSLLGTRSCFYHLVERRRYSPAAGFLF